MATDRRAIKMYDKHAERWAENLRTHKNLAHDFIEKPAMLKQLPALRGKRVLCVGCGSGEECQELLRKGAKEVVGVDLSEGLLDIARRSYPDVTFLKMDMEKLSFPKASFDVVYSSLAIHYADDWKPTLKGVYRVLAPGGVALISSQHPAYFGGHHTVIKGIKYNLLGHEKKGGNSENYKSYGDALTLRKITYMHDGMAMIAYMKPISGMVRDILASKFTIADCIEPVPIRAAYKKHKKWVEAKKRLPMFIIWELKKS